MKSFLLLFLLLFTGLSIGQDIIEMPDGTSGNVRFVGCDPDIFTDSGGTSNSYS